MANELLIKLGVENSGATKQISALNQELRYLKQELKEVDDATGGYNKTSESLNKQQKIHQDSISVLEQKLSVQKKVLEENRKELEKRKSKLEELKNTEGDHSKEIAETQKEIEKYTKAVNKSQKEIDVTEAKLDSMNRALDETTKNIEELNAQTTKSQQISEWASKIETSFGQIGKTTGMLAMTLAPITASITTCFKNITETAVDFEKALAEVRAISGLTTDGLEQVEEKAKSLGKTLPVSAKDVVDGFKYLSLAGYKLEEQLVAIEPIVKASIAWVSDLGTTSDLVTDSMSAMGMGVDQLTNYLDVLSQAQASSNTNATQMLQAYLEVGGVFSNLNIPLEESASWLGILANKGVKGAQAGNAMVAIMANLTTGTGQAGKALEQLGISAFDGVTGEFKGLSVILEELDSALSGMTEENQNYFKAMIGGKEHVADLNALLSGLGEEYDELYDQISKSGGKLEEMNAIMANTTQGKIADFQSKIEAVSLQLADIFLPTVNDVLGFLSKLAEKFLELPAGVQKAIVGISFAIVAITGLLSAISVVSLGISSLAKLWGLLGTGAQNAIVSILTKIAPVALIIAGLAAAFVLAYKNCEGFRNVVNKLAEVIKNGLTVAWQYVSDKFTQFVDFAKPYFETFVGFISEKWTNVVNFFTENLDTIKAFFAEAWSHILFVLETVFGGIFYVVSSIFTSIYNFFVENGSTIMDFFTSVWSGISTFLSDTWNFIYGVAVSVFNVLRDWWEEYGGEIQQLFSTMWNAVVGILVWIWGVIFEKASFAFQKLCDFWNTWGENIKEVFSVLWDVIKAIFESAWAIIEGVIKIGCDVVGTLISVFNRLIEGDFEGAWDLIVGFFNDSWETIKKIASKFVDAWKGIGGKIADCFKGIGDKILNMLPSWLRGWITGEKKSIDINANVNDNWSNMGRSRTQEAVFSVIPNGLFQPYSNIGIDLPNSISVAPIDYNLDRYANSAYINPNSRLSQDLQNSFSASQKGDKNELEELISINKQLLNILKEQARKPQQQIHVDTLNVGNSNNSDDAQLNMLKFFSRL